MSLNITLDGYAYDTDVSLGNSDIYYQAYFYNNSTSSSSSKWNDVRVIESSGYWNCNLGDSDFLGQTGVVLAGSKVVLVFWKGDPDRTADCGVLTEWGAFELDITSASFYTNDIQTKVNIAPNLVWANNIPAHGYVNTTYTISNSSTDVHEWNFTGILSPGSVTMNHWYTRYGQDINSVNRIEYTDYVWGDSESSLGLTGTTNGTHSYDTAGTYTIDIEVFDYCGGSITDSVEVDMYWHIPAPNITRCTEVGATQGNTIYPPDTEVFFKYVGTDVDDTITSIDWIIHDSGAYGNTDTIVTVSRDDIIAHTAGEGTSWDGHVATPGAFTNPGTRNVSMVVHWYDGYQSQTVTYNENFTQSTFSGPPVANLICNEATGNNVPIPSTLVSFDYTGTNPDSRITGIDWNINDDATDTVITNVPYNTTVHHTEGLGGSWYGSLSTPGAFSNSGSHSIAIKVHWNDGWADREVNYSENITQGLFSGPVLSMDQVPPKAVVASGVTFVNTSTNIDRVGLSLPDHEEYKWVWADKFLVESELDKPYEYEFTKVPTSAQCIVYLYADWSDGWSHKTSWIDETVVFDTTVTVTPEDCYYSINIIGTSSDGSATSYNWTVSSGISETGPWDVVWESPTDIDQQQKTLCFSATGWYKVTGYVNGTGATTSDYETLLITETCPDSAAIYNIWNGTGILDIEVDWQRTGAGVETTASKYRGTNGLDVIYDKADSVVEFTRTTDSDINDYDFLSFWINIREWDSKKDVYIKLFSSNYTYGTTLGLSNYINTSNINTWTRVMIPLSRFNLKAQFAELGWPTLINSLTFETKGNIDYWLDNVALSMGSLVTVPVCPPDMEIADIGDLTMTAQNIGTVPMVATEPPGIEPITPDVSVISPFPKPINI